VCECLVVVLMMCVWNCQLDRPKLCVNVYLRSHECVFRSVILYPFYIISSFSSDMRRYVFYLKNSKL
jgi:hypothetical protein